MRVFATLRCFVKRQLARVMIIDSYCHRCGGTVQDYYAPDRAWAQAAIGEYEILCYNCFSKRCWDIYLHGAWALIHLEELTPEQRQGFNKLLGEVT